MSLAAPTMSFRFADSEISELDWIVKYHRDRVGNIFLAKEVNRTSVLRNLINLEFNRIEEEEQRARELLEKKTRDELIARDIANGQAVTEKWIEKEGNDQAETQREKKSRLQRERRAKARAKK